MTDDIERFVFSPQLCYWRSLDQSRIDSRYLYYWLSGPEFFTQFMSVKGQTDMADYVSLRDQRRMLLTLPALDEQRAIADVLGALDDKIELNRRMNETLEALAKTRFAKSSAQLNGAPGLFGDIAGLRRIGVDPSEAVPTTPYIALEHMPRRSIALSEWGTLDGVVSGKSAFDSGSILFGKLRPYFHKVGVAPLAGIEPKSANWFSLALMYASSDAFVAYADATSSGTKMPRASWNDLANYEVSLPTEVAARELDVQIRPMIDRIVHNVHESRTLAELRDALLPRLISGELRVRDAEAAIEAAEPT